MKNYSRKTNKSLTRYRTPATFRLRAAINTRNVKLGNAPPGSQERKYGK